MHGSLGRDRVYIIAELHPQHGGHLGMVQSMIMQCKMAGADAVKLQLYDSMALEGDTLRRYLELSSQELKALKAYADATGIDLFASVFDRERVDWCEEAGFEYYKVASRSVDDRALCEAMIRTGKPVFMSLGMYDWRTGMPYQADNVNYFFCVSEYPATLDDIHMPSFGADGPGFIGFSDHTVGISACAFAVMRGARFLEKHYTMSRSALCATERAHVCAMDFDELRSLRAMADDVVRLRSSADNAN